MGLAHDKVPSIYHRYVHPYYFLSTPYLRIRGYCAGYV